MNGGQAATGGELTRQNARDIERLSILARAVGVESNGSGTVEFERRRARGVVAGNTSIASMFEA